MSVMFELWYTPPADHQREVTLAKKIAAFGGRLDYREKPNLDPGCGICLTYEFDDWEQAKKTADLLRQEGEFIEGPQEYGD